ncbi:MAG: hypothetical protein ACXVIJ_01025 [Thermoanaerobaculia bacterium]
MNTSRTGLLALVAALIIAVPVFADSVSKQMTVSTRVIARAVVTVDPPAAIVVTADDVARGYVDVTQPIQVRVRTNSRNGYVLQAEKTTEAFSAIELTNETTSMSVSSHETWLQRPYVAGGDVMSLRARLYLAPGPMAGAQAVPVAFSATPI